MAGVREVKSATYFRSSIGGYFFDVVFRENYVFTNEITQHPVQSGAAINDHVYRKPTEITFDVAVSDCLGSVVKGQFDKLSSRSATALAIFFQLWSAALPLQINASVGGATVSYKDMVIKTLSITRDKTTMNALRMTIMLQQVIRVNATTVALTETSTVTDTTPPAASSDPHTTGATTGGRVAATTVQSSTPYAPTSVATYFEGLVDFWTTGKGAWWAGK